MALSSLSISREVRNIIGYQKQERLLTMGRQCSYAFRRENHGGQHVHPARRYEVVANEKVTSTHNLGTLNMYLDKETYERAGLAGKPYGAKGGRGLKPRWSKSSKSQESKLFTNVDVSCFI